MKRNGINFCITLISVLSFLGCSSAFYSSKKAIPEDTLVEEAVQTEEAVAQPTKYPDEESVLEKVLAYYDDAQAAYEDVDFGLAESKIDSAFVLISSVDIDSIQDEDLVGRFKNAVFSLGKSLGTILSDSEKISQEDYTSWIEELENIEDFKSGRWTDEELRKIVLKISLKSDMPIEYNEQVKKAIYFFQTNRRKEMTTWLRRSGRYLPLIRQILTEEGLPQDMAYLSMIESGFNPNAYSRARCVGLWQFFYATGKLYGLDRDEWVDERKDPIKSTKAAAKHLNDLYQLYNDWNLTMAAYNCGPARITRQFQQTPDINYWEMKLPTETKSYVPFFMAALIIAKEPELFGFEKIEYDPPLEFDTVEVHPYTNLKRIAEQTSVSLEELRDLNAELRRDYTPAGKEMYHLRIPKGAKETFLAEYAKIEPEKYVPPRVSGYSVRRGDTLSGIAQRFGVSVTSLMNANNLRNAHRLSVGQRLKIPGGKEEYVASAVSDKSDDVVVSKEKTDVYVVRKDDSLGLVATKFKTSVSVLQSLNKMGKSTKIYVGQRLIVPGSGSSGALAQKSDSSRSTDAPEQITYVIQEGDSLYDIARTYNVDYKDLILWNKIKDHRKIQPGQSIIIKKTKG
ncbi:LysM peptidoglycan-binding domain-containing protein [bacterium]|nr:LysM peptidoglycan-binding domain-containing protein [bacterium]